MGDGMRACVRELVQATHLSRLHLLCASAEGHVGVVGAGAVPLLLLDGGDEGAAAAASPLAAPVLVHLLDQSVVLLQQQLRLLQRHQLRNKTFHLVYTSGTGVFNLVLTSFVNNQTRAATLLSFC